MVMPHSALQAGQYSKWRTGLWEAISRRQGEWPNVGPHAIVAVDFGYKTAWDLEGLKPNTFFPVPASVVFRPEDRREVADCETPVRRGGALAGQAGHADVIVAKACQPSPTPQLVVVSPYLVAPARVRQSFPRCLFFVVETENLALIVQAGRPYYCETLAGAHLIRTVAQS